MAKGETYRSLRIGSQALMCQRRTMQTAASHDAVLLIQKAGHFCVVYSLEIQRYDPHTACRTRAGPKHLRHRPAVLNLPKSGGHRPVPSDRFPLYLLTRCNPTPRGRPMMPADSSVPASSLSGRKSGMASRWDTLPVPPSITGEIRSAISSVSSSAPIPWGPSRPLWPVTQSADR